MPHQAIISAFIEAAELLTFAFEPAFTLVLPSGKTLKTLGWLRDFGSPAGTLLFAESASPSRDELEVIKTMGFHWSLLFPTYSTFQEAHFKDTLDDWKYYGLEANRPSWYKGKAWST